MTGQFHATRPVSRHRPLADPSTAICVASSTTEWVTCGRNWSHISNSVGPSTLGLFTAQRDPKDRGGEAWLSFWPSSPPRFECGAADWVLLRREMEALPP